MPPVSSVQNSGSISKPVHCVIVSKLLFVRFSYITSLAPSRFMPFYSIRMPAPTMTIVAARPH